ncbi:hypothetical protein H257_05113 [Aphanomyces astaci]|uniref:Uncharacterized protein n=1 Tax=Aphanomyces astaci TaxID=112090 RepID=W4GU15_APHAT|nr:hypothetical protein H257_05113 [Aphanomyces astaci]ETV82504.1 hypothetical protein H257_05113 [Aphanomyces astaci]|eukprot:XP_009828173.1 hypothetical protein H257_05113 [Aphanomyces astaci]
MKLIICQTSISVSLEPPASSLLTKASARIACRIVQTNVAKGLVIRLASLGIKAWVGLMSDWMARLSHRQQRRVCASIKALSLSARSIVDSHSWMACFQSAKMSTLLQFGYIPSKYTS